MTGINKRNMIIFGLFICAVILLFVFCSDSLAQEGPSKGRRIWNNIMLWVNFGILVFLFIKFAKNPLMNFLYGERKKFAKRIDELEGEVRKAKSAMEVEAEKLKHMDKNIEEIHQRIIELGQREKTQTIEKAKATADRMLEDAKQEAKYRIEAAKKKFGEEMLDIAVSIALEGLTKGLSQEDNEKLIEQFSTDLSTEKIRVA